MTRKVLQVILSLAAVIGSLSSAGFGQAASKQMAAIPFKFVFEGTILPAGTYEVELMDSGMLLLLDSNRDPVEGEAATLPLPMEDVAEDAELVFVNSSEGYTLVEVRTKEERRLLTSQYGHGKRIEQQFRSVPITAAAEVSDTSSKQAPTQGR